MDAMMIPRGRARSAAGFFVCNKSNGRGGRPDGAHYSRFSRLKKRSSIESKTIFSKNADWNNCRRRSGDKEGQVGGLLTSGNDFLGHLSYKGNKRDNRAVFVFLQQKQLIKAQNAIKYEKRAKPASIVVSCRRNAQSKTLPSIFINDFCVGTAKATEETWR